jgi:diaminopimelate epimerase
MQALGNDFVVIDATSQVVEIDREQAQRIADRRRGVGCDQILLVEKPSHDDVDFQFRIINADGGEVAQCGNGARCLALFVREVGLTDKTEIRVETAADVLTLHVLEDGQVRVNMAVPRFEPEEIPFIATKRQEVYELALEDGEIEISALSLGNPHAVRVVKDVDRAPVVAQGRLIERHQRFPERANAGFMQVCDRGHIRLRVYERGAGETPACGSGACAAVVAGKRLALLDNSVIVDLPGGRLRVDWAGNAQPVYLTGPAECVFEGELKPTLLTPRVEAK